MAELQDGTVLPSYLSAQYADTGGPSGSLSDTTLRVGEVVAAYSPTDPLNNVSATKNKQWIYVVHVSYRDGTGARSVVPYRCTVADLFGGLGDHVRYTVRKTDGASQGGFGRGARVLILCPNGDKSNALIVGGVRHVDDLSADPSDTFWDFAFNGVRATIDADGAFCLTVPGATKLDGTPGERNKNNHGSKVSFARDGVITVDDRHGDSVVISPEKRSIEIKSHTHNSRIGQKWYLKAPVVEVVANKVVVQSNDISLGDQRAKINKLDEAVIGSGIDIFTGNTYFALNNTSKKVRVKK